MQVPMVIIPCTKFNFQTNLLIYPSIYCMRFLCSCLTTPKPSPFHHPAKCQSGPFAQVEWCICNAISRRVHNSHFKCRSYDPRTSENSCRPSHRIGLFPHGEVWHPLKRIEWLRTAANEHLMMMIGNQNAKSHDC